MSLKVWPLIILLGVACQKHEVKEHIVGYEIHEMIRASDSLHYKDTVSIIYRKGDSIFIREKPDGYSFQR